uniref:Uncharacterized protein n=1 Tax=Physcomitrium patens TaxID=3218 RepID=A0A7I4EQZ0_PHYPA
MVLVVIISMSRAVNNLRKECSLALIAKKSRLSKWREVCRQYGFSKVIRRKFDFGTQILICNNRRTIFTSSQFILNGDCRGRI